MRVDLSKLHVNSVVIPALFQSSHVKDEVIKEAGDGIRALNLLISEMLDQEITPFSIKIEDIAEMIGADKKKLRRDIKNAMKTAHDKYDGVYDPPTVVEVDKIFYIMSAIVIADNGRMSNDIIEYVVRTNLDEYFDIGALDTAYDFACYIALIDYFETCLRNGRVALTPFLKQYSNSMVTTRRLESYFKKNWWYGDPDTSERLFMLNTESPSISSVTNAMLENLNRILQNTEEANFDIPTATN